ncbi:MAG: ABC-type transport auxiliary lipoprotein family protein [Desulfovibrio sp.]|jgi:cholesterol transport system auxiliary component|nr:ABC-type transport auxiliary lipoprotein family protein [Desulfovibrio sp.]
MNAHRKAPVSSSALSPLIFLLIPAFCLAGCGSLLNSGPAPTRLLLKPTLPHHTPGRTVNKQLVAAAPTSGNIPAGDGITVVFRNREIRMLAAARWTSEVPLLIQRSLVDALEATGGLRGVGDDTMGLQADVRLLTDIREFGLRWGEDDALPVGVFAAVFRLLDLRTGRISESLHVETTAPAAGKSNTDLALACEAALGKGLAQCAAWVLAGL